MDILENRTLTISVLDHGFVTLVDLMPRIIDKTLLDNGYTADIAVIEAARVSYGKGLKSIDEDKKLLRYMMAHSHTSPFEMIELKFIVQLPIFIARQWIRHRTWSYNEISARYSELEDIHHIPATLRIQNKSGNKQGSSGELASHVDYPHAMKVLTKETYELYQHLVKVGVAKEQAREILTLNTYTRWICKVDLHNLLHFLRLRMDSHAQLEMQLYAAAIFSLIKDIFPWTIEAWLDYIVNSVKLSKDELLAFQRKEHNLSKSELIEYKRKEKILMGQI